MWWLGLFFDRLSLDVARCGAPGPDDARPLAICDRLRVLDADDGARVLGIVPGMKRAAALALAPGLRLRERDDAGEQATLDSLAAWALQFTPAVSLQSDLSFGDPDDTPRPCGLLLEVAPSLRYFGGSDALLARLRQGLRALGFPARIGAAPTAAAAWLFARDRDGLQADEAGLEAALRSLPAVLLARSRAQRETLDAIGAHRIDDLLALPRAGLARRCGRTLLDEIDRALGRQPEPRRWFEAPERFETRIELLAQVEHAEALLFAARRLLDRLAGWLAARHCAVREFTVHAEHDRRSGREQRTDTLLTVRLADPSRDVERLGTLLREKLAITRLPAPVRALRLRCDEVLALPGASTQLFPAPAAARESLARLVERLQARLGPRQVQRLALVADHRPEVAYRVEAFDAPPGPPASAPRPGPRPRPPGPLADAPAADSLPVDSLPADAPVANLPRPLWLLREPIAIGERNNRPWWHSALTLLAGPERIEGGWWDASLVQRDYFIAEDESHALYWIYRERLAPDDARRGWFVQGRFG
ncbi:MAG: DNA polymerase Y family protein [Burkholderiaceae bacterium]|nr:DNA polymerase Y family protein [Burkholderiaceae bacterium]